MGEGTTLLSYEMGWQLRLFDLMASSQQSGDYIMACTYGEAFLQFLGFQTMPQKRIAEKSGANAELDTWRIYYSEILMAGVGKIGETINSVRKHYKPEMGIPKYKKQEVSN